MLKMMVLVGVGMCFNSVYKLKNETLTLIDFIK